MSKSHFEVESKFLNGLISNRKASSLNQNDKGNIKVAVKRKKRVATKIKAKSEILDGKVILDLPLQTLSEANCFEHWTKKHKRHKLQQRTVALFLKPVRDKIKLPCKILFTRLAPNRLDKHDNLPMSFKYIVDAVCAIITGNFQAGKADSDERIFIAYDQLESKIYGVRITFS